MKRTSLCTSFCLQHTKLAFENGSSFFEDPCNLLILFGESYFLGL
jgi:hypothetical protein